MGVLWSWKKPNNQKTQQNKTKTNKQQQKHQQNPPKKTLGKKPKLTNRNCVLRKWAIGNKTFADSKQCTKIQQQNVGTKGRSFILSCPAATTKLLLRKKIFVKRGDIFIFCHKRRGNKKNCTVSLCGLVQTSMKPAASRERTEESSESTGQNNVQINIHEKL